MMHTWKAKPLMPEHIAPIALTPATCLGSTAGNLSRFVSRILSTWGFKARKCIRHATDCVCSLVTARKMPKAPAPASACPSEDFADTISKALSIPCRSYCTVSRVVTIRYEPRVFHIRMYYKDNCKVVLALCGSQRQFYVNVCLCSREQDVPHD